MSEPLLVYFSSQSQNTHRFVGKVGLPAKRICVSPKDKMPEIDQEFILICPTFAGDQGQGAVPKQVIRFLNNKRNRSLMKGVIASGNRNFGKYFGHAGVVISKKCGVPLLYKFELMGTQDDVVHVREGVVDFWRGLSAKDSLVLEQ